MPPTKSAASIVALCLLFIAACALVAHNWPRHAARTVHAAPPAGTHAAAPMPPKRPNIIFILADDLATNLLDYIPNVQAMQREGTTFTNYFVTDSLCCPSRSSIFTGKLPHNTGVFTNQPPDGGYEKFNTEGNDAHTFAAALQQSGYKTAMLGKYLNGYLPFRAGAQPGWNEWDVSGLGYGEFNYNINQNGRLIHYKDGPNDYLTDVVSRLGQAFIKRTADHQYFIEIATFAPHAPYIPAPRDADKFPDLKAPHTPAWAAKPDANAPAWLKAILPLRPIDIQAIDKAFRMRAQSVVAIDKMIGEIRAMLAASGDTDTYIFFSSDNGYHMGEYNLRPGKMTAFDTDIRVPLVVVGPDVAKDQVVDAVVENIDLAPTFAELGGASDPLQPDGRSLLPLLRGEHPAWRDLALIEHHHPTSTDDDPDAPLPHGGNPPTYNALRSPTTLYVEYEGGETESYDLTQDPDELHNIAKTLPAAKRQQWHAALEANTKCKGADACWTAQHLPQKDGGE
jgi:N-acetylglucosamine-6-sulfatase